MTTTLQSPEPNLNAKFGWCVALNEDLIVIGSPAAYVNGHASGNVLVFNSEGDLLTTLEPLHPINAGPFGASLAIKDDIIVVGDNAALIDSLHDKGRVYIFDSSGNLLTTIQSPSTHQETYFGWEVSFCGDTILVSEPGSEVDDIPKAGKVYRYNIDGDLLTTIQSPEPRAPGQRAYNFGYSVAGSEDRIIVGELYVTIDEKNEAGRAHVFNIDGSLRASLQSPDPQEIGKFGVSVAYNGDFIVVGESHSTVNGLERAGKAHVFSSDGDFLFTLLAPKPEEGARFGISAAINDESIVVGESQADVQELNEGKVHVFDLDGNLQATLVSPEPQISAEFGYYLAIFNEKIVVGEPGSKVEGEGKAGKAYVFEVGAAETTSPVATETPVKTDSQPKDGESRGGIPGFPLTALLIGVIVFGYIIMKNNRISSKPIFFLNTLLRS